MDINPSDLEVSVYSDSSDWIGISDRSQAILIPQSRSSEFSCQLCLRSKLAFRILEVLGNCLPSVLGDEALR